MLANDKKEKTFGIPLKPTRKVPCTKTLQRRERERKSYTTSIKYITSYKCITSSICVHYIFFFDGNDWVLCDVTICEKIGKGFTANIQKTEPQIASPGLIPDRTKTQGLKITDGIVYVLQMVWLSSSRQGGKTNGPTSQRFNWLIWLTLRLDCEQSLVFLCKVTAREI